MKKKSFLLCCERNSDTAWTLSGCRKEGRGHLEFVCVSIVYAQEKSHPPKTQFPHLKCDIQPKLADILRNNNPDASTSAAG
eukprot:245216-Pelagomonas_calceolata.AAC.20